MPDTPISCAPPPGAGASPYYFTNFSSGSLAFTTNGSLIASVFPLCTRIPGASYLFSGAVGLVGVSLASSILNLHSGDVCAVILAVDRGPSFSLAGASNVLCLHQANQNSSAGTANASCRGTALDLGQNSALPLGAGQQLSLYACSANDAGNLLSGTAVFWFIPQ